MFLPFGPFWNGGFCKQWFEFGPELSGPDALFPLKCLGHENIGPAPLQKCVGDFCCINYGGICQSFSSRIFLGTVNFPTENEEKKSDNKIRKKKRRPKNKIPEKFRSSKNRPQKTNPKLLRPKFFCGCLRSTSVQKCLFSRIWRA